MKASNIKKGEEFEHTRKPFKALSDAEVCKHKNKDNTLYVCLSVRRTDTGRETRHYVLKGTDHVAPF